MLVHPVDPEATRALREAERALGRAHIAQGERRATPLVDDVAVDASDLTLRIAWETAALLNLFDLVMHGDRRLLLGASR